MRYRIFGFNGGSITFCVEFSLTNFTLKLPKGTKIDIESLLMFEPDSQTSTHFSSGRFTKALPDPQINEHALPRQQHYQQYSHPLTLPPSPFSPCPVIDWNTPLLLIDPLLQCRVA